MAIIAIENLSKTFVVGRRIRHLLFFKGKPSWTRIPALQEITLTIQEGEFFGLMGPNGSGKTTLLKILATLILPDSGTVKVNGCDLRSESSIKQSIGLVTGEERSFYWRLTGRQNLEFFASLYRLSARHSRQRICSLCESLQIDNPDRPFQEYSTGLKQRFALARALLHNPPILFLDEPTRSLDQKSAERFRALVKQLVHEQNKTVIYATHLAPEAKSLFDRVGLLRQGRLINQGKWSEIAKDYLC